MADKPPFILTQGIRLLLDTDRPQRFLRAEYFRVGRSAGPARPDADPGSWIEITRSDLAGNRLCLDGRPCDLSRVAVTTDAGVGKTVALRWLCAELNSGRYPGAAFLLTFGQFPADTDELLPRVLAPAVGHAPLAEAIRALERLREQGRVTLLVDALDQAPADGAAFRGVRAVLDDPAWRSCRIIVSGRPYALQRHWAELFATELGFGWRYVQLDEFDPDEQRRFLGRDESGRDRYDLLPNEAREIMATPRVLEYLRDVPDRELRQIRTVGDVYWRSLNHLLKEGLKNSTAARRMGLEADEPAPATVQARSLDRAREVLGTIAFRMTATPIPRTAEAADDALGASPDARWGPNFDGVPPGRFQAFKDEVYTLLARRPGAAPRQSLERDIDSLAALNDFVAHGIFDTDVSGLDRILWRNRTLQEFFTAYWLSQFCSPAETPVLDGWRYLPEHPASEEYYWVWRFLCEMHADGRDPAAWTRAVEPLLRPGDGTATGTRRSGELLYRLWAPLTAVIRGGEVTARAARDRFWGEFETEILSGRRGPEAQQRARQFCDSFRAVPAGEFQMGAPPEKQGITDELREAWRRYLEQDGDPQQRAEQHIAQWSFSPSKSGQKDRAWWLQWWTRVFRDRDLDAVIRRSYTADETPEEPVQRLDGFLLSHWPTINAWYRLFDPGHGQGGAWYRETYDRISPAADNPAIFISWYDAWAFCQWARWDGRSCRLPREFEWEYAAKAGTPWDWNYWWGDEFDAQKCNAEQRAGHTTAPTDAHANPWGFVDILGNVWEWCADAYCKAYSRAKSAEAESDGSARVLRGGSWDNLAVDARSACRNLNRPADSGDYVGFRVARALSRKS